MKTNNLFSFQRFILLARQSLIINKKLIAIALISYSGMLFLVLFLFQSMNNFRWNDHDTIVTFIILFLSLGIISSSLSYPAFRSKEKSSTYLLLPASALEKYLFEILTRIIVFIIVYPVLFWLVANLEGAVVHHYVERLTSYTFSFGQAYSDFTKYLEKTEGARFLVIQVAMFAFIAVFTGASHFTKSPLLKTLFTFSIIIVGYYLFVFLLVKGLNIIEYSPRNQTILFINFRDHQAIFFATALTVINLCLLTIAWFTLKEKEV